MRAVSAVLLALFLWPAPAPAGSGVGAAYLLRGASAKEDALGQCSLAVLDSPSGQWRSPAFLAHGQQGWALGFDHEITPLGGGAELAAASFRQNEGALGLLYYYRADQDSYRDDQGFEGAGFSNTETTLALNAGRNLGRWSFGLGVKVLTQGLAGRQASGGLMGDGGLLIQGFNGRVSAAVNLRNIGKVPAFEGFGVYSPSSAEFGLREQLDEAGRYSLYQELRWLAAKDFSGARISAGSVQGREIADPTQVSLGAGAQALFPFTAATAALRAGYNATPEAPALPFGLSAGLGVEGSGLAFDYAVSFLGPLGLSHRLGLTWKLSASASGQPPPRKV